MTSAGSNTYLLGSGSERILLDTGEGRSSWRDALSSTITSEQATIKTALLSHWHHDHIGGIDDLRALQTDNEVAIHKHNPDYDPYSQLDTSTISPINDGQRFRNPCGFEVQALYTPGHTEDHMCFVITDSPDPEEIGNIFTADNVLGHGTAVFEDLQTYIDSLQIMKTAVSNNAHKKVKAYPGHGAVIEDARAKIAEYIEHRHMREQEALNVLKYGTPTPPPADSDSEASTGGLEIITGKEWASMEMVKVIYRHYPENLWEPAERGLLMVLDKLQKEGRVDKGSQGGWILLDKAAL